MAGWLRARPRATGLEAERALVPLARGRVLEDAVGIAHRHEHARSASGAGPGGRDRSGRRDDTGAARRVKAWRTSSARGARRRRRAPGSGWPRAARRGPPRPRGGSASGDGAGAGGRGAAGFGAHARQGRLGRRRWPAPRAPFRARDAAAAGRAAWEVAVRRAGGGAVGVTGAAAASGAQSMAPAQRRAEERRAHRPPPPCARDRAAFTPARTRVSSARCAERQRGRPRLVGGHARPRRRSTSPSAHSTMRASGSRSTARTARRPARARRRSAATVSVAGSQLVHRVAAGQDARAARGWRARPGRSRRAGPQRIVRRLSTATTRPSCRRRPRRDHGRDAAAQLHPAEAQPVRSRAPLEAAEQRRQSAFRQRSFRGVDWRSQEFPPPWYERAHPGRA